MEPFTIAAVGGALLTGGVAFLYEQVGEILRRRREAREAGLAMGEGDLRLPEFPGEYFEGDRDSVVLEEEQLAVHEDVLTDAWERTARFASGARAVDPADPDVLARVDQLRSAVEQLRGRPITFLGEDRAAASVRVARRLGTVAGQDVGADIERLHAGDVVVRDEIERVEVGGSTTGVRIGDMGAGPAGPAR